MNEISRTRRGFLGSSALTVAAAAGVTSTLGLSRGVPAAGADLLKTELAKELAEAGKARDPRLAPHRLDGIGVGYVQWTGSRAGYGGNAFRVF